jgi:hypothetical protein
MKVYGHPVYIKSNIEVINFVVLTNLYNGALSTMPQFVFTLGPLTFLLFVIFLDPEVHHFLTADEQKPESARAPAGDNAEVRN